MQEDEIKSYALKKQLLYLRDSRGNGTSMITLILPPRDQIPKALKMLVDEYGTASNIKSRVNRLSVLSAITSAQHKLRTFKSVPPNGLAIFVGTVMDNNKEKMISVAMEPLKPINTSVYMCDSRFHTESLVEQFKENETFGFIVMDGNETVFATLNSNVKKILHTLSVSLPKKHGRGGQSSVRFARLRIEKRNHYVKKVAEIANSLFTSEEGYILAGTADFKNQLFESAILLKNIKDRVIRVVDTNYGGENGLNQAIELAQDSLTMCRYLKERKVLQEFFKNLENDMVVYGQKNTLRLLDEQAVTKLIVYENIEGTVDDQLVIDWLLENYKQYNAELSIVSDKSTEGEQFKEGFGGIGGILKYKCYEDDGYESVESDEIF